MAVGCVEPRKVGNGNENGNETIARTWYGRCVHPKMYVVPEFVQAVVARANPRGLTLCLGIALHFLEEPPYCAAPRDDFRVRVVERVAAYG
jgi:hypothetical protein